MFTVRRVGCEGVLLPCSMSSRPGCPRTGLPSGGLTSSESVPVVCRALMDGLREVTSAATVICDRGTVRHELPKIYCNLLSGWDCFELQNVMLFSTCHIV